MRCPALLLALALATTGCRDRDTPRTAVSDTSNVPRVNPATTSGAVVLELWQLRPGVSLADWKNAHPDEPVIAADTTASLRQFGDWCAAAQRRITIGRHEVTRTALFYPPAPGVLALPDSAADLLRGCELGLVWVSVPAGDSASGARLTDSVRTQLAEAFGRLVNGPVQFYGSAYWSNVSRFRQGSVTAVAAFRNTPAATDSARDRAVLAFAYQPNAGIGTGDDAPSVARTWSPPDTMPLDSVVDQSRLGIEGWAPLAALLRRAEAERQATVSSPARVDTLARALRRWLSASQAQPLPARAAALYVADAVLNRSLCAFVRCDHPADSEVTALRALGAQLAFEPLGASWVYQRTWLVQARVLDRDSPLGRRILLEQMNAGFDFSGNCANGPEGFRKVIDLGEKYLARVPGSPIEPDVHFLVGEAYRDIVALAHGAGSDYADVSRYTPEAPAAAQSAIEHYRLAMRAGANSPVAQAAWRQAWWLKAGLPPRDVRFFCVYD
jgi:hypothetical protein